MSEKKIAISEATEAELRAFAEAYLGITLPANAKVETLRAKVAAAWSKSEILVPEKDEAAPQQGTPPKPVTKAQQPPEQGKVKIILQRTEEAGGDEPVPVGVNGRVMLVPRGEEVEIPQAYFEVLQNAIRHVYDPLPDGGLSATPRKVPAYPFQRVA